jgi:hypothetical protein
MSYVGVMVIAGEVGQHFFFKNEINSYFSNKEKVLP